MGNILDVCIQVSQKLTFFHLSLPLAHSEKLWLLLESRFLRHPGIQDGRKNSKKLGKLVKNVMRFVAKLSIERTETTIPSYNCFLSSFYTYE